MELGNACEGLRPNVIDELRAIVSLHEDATGLIVKLANLAGEKAEKLMATLPEGWRDRLGDLAEVALRQAYDTAFATQADADTATILSRVLAWADGERWHKVATGMVGALGGFGGFVTTLADLPVTTTLILRSVQQIAASYGEDASSPDVRAQCLAVFAMGGPLQADDEVDAGLWAVRTALNGKAAAEVLTVVLPRFGVIVSEKALAQATPILGALGGAIVNPIFTSFYQTMAHVHFRLRKLERDGDPDQLRACFSRLALVHRNASKTRRKPQS